MHNQIILHDYFVTIISDSINTELHSHIAHQITFSLTSEPFQIELEENIKSNLKVFIPSQTKHKFLNSTGKFLTILIDNETTILEKKLSHKLNSINTIPKDLNEIESLLIKLGLRNDQQIDDRIKSLLDLINNYENLENIRILDIAKKIGLSESRLLHLFKSEIGVPFRKYILWNKLKRAFYEISDNKIQNFAEIALNAGFSDSAHFSKVIKATFGLSPSEILNNSQFIQEINKHEI